MFLWIIIRIYNIILYSIDFFNLLFRFLIDFLTMEVFKIWK